MTNSFNDLGLSEKSLAAVARLGYSEPTPVQAQAIPLALQGRDIIAAAKTGTGKTAAFSLPSMDRLGHIQRGQGPLMLVITPTRELAAQIGTVCEAIATSTHHRILTVVGGLSYDPQIKQLKHGVDILIATPGRLIDLMEQGAVRLGNVEVLVLDEADRMLDMGFWPSVKKIVAATPASRQTMLFSATIDEQISKSANTILRDPAFVEIAHRGETADSVEQFVIPVSQTAKPALLKAVLEEKGADRVIVFARTRSRADSSCRRLKKAGFSVEAIHSDRSQSQRKRALDNFAAGKTSVLVATDVLARGIDVSEVDYVINYDLPNQPEDYVHRIGRTGRAGETGFSISFVSPEQKPWLRDIEKLIKKEIPELKLKNFDEQEAEAQAAARATNYAATRDPELAAAAKEQAKRDKKKSQKGSSAASASQVPAAGRSSQGGRKSKANQATKANQSGQPARAARNTNEAAPGNEAGKKKTSSQSQGQKRQKASQEAKPAAKAQQRHPKKAAARKEPARSDMRPGRSRRAAVAQQRGRKS